MSEDGQPEENWQQRRDEWIERVTELAHEVEVWAKTQGWSVEWGRKTITEELLGSYQVPILIVRIPDGELQVQPIALHVVGANGRVDLEAYPALNRVRLVGRNGSWQIFTDSNVPLHAEWNQETFIQLAAELSA